MSDEPDNLVLRYLRRIDEKVDRMTDKMDDAVRRIGGLELGVAKCGVAVAELGVRMDTVDRSLARIERRLDLVDERATS